MSLASPTHTWTPRRRMIASVSGVLLVGAVIVVIDQPVFASAPTISVANATITCIAVTGLATFSPHLRTPGTIRGLEMVHLNLALSRCSSPALSPPITITGQLKGALVSNTGTSCATTLGSSTYSSVGTLTAHWKIHKAKISPTSSFAPQRVKLAKVQRKAATNQTIKVGGPGSPHPSVVGDFTGGNGGRSSSFTLSWKRSAVTCSAGLSVLPIVSGALTFS